MPNFLEIENIFRTLRREVWIVTAAANNRRGGLLATWVSPASIDRDRPVVLIGIAPNHFTAELIDASRAFAAHLLHPDQTATAFDFAIGSGRDRDKFATHPATAGVTGSPVLDSSLAWLECRVFARLATGDRNYYWADVVASQWSAGTPLTDRDLFAAASDEQKRLLIANRDDDVRLQQAWHTAWRDQLPELLSPRDAGSAPRV